MWVRKNETARVGLENCGLSFNAKYITEDRFCQHQHHPKKKFSSLNNMCYCLSTKTKAAQPLIIFPLPRESPPLRPFSLPHTIKWMPFVIHDNNSSAIPADIPQRALPEGGAELWQVGSRIRYTIHQFFSAQPTGAG